MLEAMCTSVWFYKLLVSFSLCYSGLAVCKLTYVLTNSVVCVYVYVALMVTVGRIE